MKKRILIILSVLILISIATTFLIGQSKDMVFRMNNGTEPQTLDPAIMTGVPEFRIAMQIFEGLTAYHP